MDPMTPAEHTLASRIRLVAIAGLTTLALAACGGEATPEVEVEAPEVPEAGASAETSP